MSKHQRLAIEYSIAIVAALGFSYLIVQLKW